jgi:molecular chaperone GrpE
MGDMKKREVKIESDKQETLEKKRENQELELTCSEDSLDFKDLENDDRGRGSASFENSEGLKKEKPETKKEDLAKLLEEKEEELRQKHDLLLRTQADYENYKKRMARERSNLLRFGNETLVKELLPVIDNLERSLEHARNAKTIDNIIEGIEMIQKEFLEKLEKFGLKVISAQGEKFDPTRHEATSQVETSEYPENTIINELQKGYFIHDRLLRPAMVIVARSPNSPESEPPNS